MTDYLVAGGHPDTLASGRPIAPGDTVPAAAVNHDDPHDQALIEAGTLIDVQADRAQAEAGSSESSSTDGTSARSGDAQTVEQPPQGAVKQITSSDSVAQTATSGPDASEKE